MLKVYMMITQVPNNKNIIVNSVDHRITIEVGCIVEQDVSRNINRHTDTDRIL